MRLSTEERRRYEKRLAELREQIDHLKTCFVGEPGYATGMKRAPILQAEYDRVKLIILQDDKAASSS